MNNMEIKVSVKDIPEVIEQLQKAEEKINNLQSKIDRANELLQLLHYNFKDEDSIHNEIEDIQKVLKEDKQCQN